MPAPSCKTPQRIRQMMSMHKRGASTREIGEELGVSHRTISLWLVSAGLQPNGGNGERATRARREPAPVAVSIADATEELSKFTATGAIFDRAASLKQLSARFEQVSASANSLAAGIKDGTTNPSAFTTLVKLEADLASRIAEMTPPEAPDPEKDPSNLEAAAEVRAKITRLGEAARANARCANCGMNPFTKGKVA